MCFSATASFTAGGVLLGLGTLTLRSARRSREVSFAAIPLLFAVQQLSEGIIWWTFIVGLYLLFLIVEFPVTAVAAENIVYVSPHFYKIPVMLLYLAATCVSCFFSSNATIRLFGVLALLLFALAYGFFAVALFSVWCFFAALLSAIIFVHFKFGRRIPVRWLGGVA